MTLALAKCTALLTALLAGCASTNTFDTPAEAVPFCMALGEVPVIVEGRVACSGDLTPPSRRP